MLYWKYPPRVSILTITALAAFSSLFAFYYALSRVTPTSLEHHSIPESPLSRDGPKIAKVSVAANRLDNSMIHRALQSHQTQNEMHGYHHYIATNQAVGDLIENEADRRPQGAWTKPAYLLSLIVAELEKPEDERLEWIFWFDADTVVVNPSTPLEVFLPPKSDEDLASVHLLIAANWDGLNSGAFALRVHPWSVSLLSAVLAYPIYMSGRIGKDRFRDQSAFQYLLQDDKSPLANSYTKGKEHWATVPMRWFNALPVNNAFSKNGQGWLFGKKMEGALFDNGTTEIYDDGNGGKIQPWKIMQGDMIVHFAGTTAGGTRDSWMGPWLDRVEALLPEWNNVTTQHRLRDETDKFWSETSARISSEKAIADAKMKLDAEKKAAADKAAEAKKAEEERKKAEEERKKADEEKQSMD
ncbi:hypothetical protein BN1708_007568 [Verticillium longisporum]|uniref:Galactosyl transferase GMA12/MNN10 family protein n=1 Tax=Verticillium longisporum TaxID=100787 RepID=A0A0G4MV73_VERLO|nr:hypothetical protein BN1708_007568 [Verticillium longisporum]